MVGVLAGSVYACFLYDGGAGYAAALFAASVVMTCAGIAFLIGGSVSGTHFFVTLTTKKDVRRPNKTITMNHAGACGQRKEVAAAAA